MNLQAIVEDISGRMADETERGEIADYIPELAKADLNHFGMAVLPVGGEMAVGGDVDLPFSMQSISKIFTLNLALDKVGNELWRRVGREASGNAFNSIVQLEQERGIPRNPLINAGAIVVADVLLSGQTVEQAVASILGFLRQAAGDDTITVDPAVAASELEYGHRNRALANFMKAEGNLLNPANGALAVYFQQCAITMTCRQLATAGHFMATPGTGKAEGGISVRVRRARRLNALMATCGHYDASGEFAFQVGIPGKSGVGGGILGVVPGRASIAAWCPGLDDKGNSVLASRAFRELARATGWSIFGQLSDEAPAVRTM